LADPIKNRPQLAFKGLFGSLSAFAEVNKYGGLLRHSTFITRHLYGAGYSSSWTPS